MELYPNYQLKMVCSEPREHPSGELQESVCEIYITSTEGGREIKQSIARLDVDYYEDESGEGHITWQLFAPQKGRINSGSM